LKVEKILSKVLGLCAGIRSAAPQKAEFQFLSKSTSSSQAELYRAELAHIQFLKEMLPKPSIASLHSYDHCKRCLQETSYAAPSESQY
jgi:hypothetical protein